MLQLFGNVGLGISSWKKIMMDGEFNKVELAIQIK